MTVCDLGSGTRCLISLQCSFEQSWFGCLINYAACFIVHIAKYLEVNEFPSFLVGKCALGKPEFTHPSTGYSQYKNWRKYSFTNLKIYHAYEISTHSPK